MATQSRSWWHICMSPRHEGEESGWCVVVTCGAQMCLRTSQRESVSSHQASAFLGLLIFPFVCLLFCVSLPSNSDASTSVCLIGRSLVPALPLDRVSRKPESGFSHELGITPSSDGSRVSCFWGTVMLRYGDLQESVIGPCVSMVNSSKAAILVSTEPTSTCSPPNLTVPS